MRKIVLAIACIQVFVSVTTAQTTKPAKGIAGIWKLVEFSDFDSVSRTWINRYGKNPRGYFIYSPGGILSINVSSDTPLKITEEGSKNYNINFHEFFSSHSFGYFAPILMNLPKGR
jgi:hypothetical protein